MLTVINRVCNVVAVYGKLFSSMFEGSLYGKGWGPLLVMSYVIANGVPDREIGMLVELNPKALADKFGESEAEVLKAIDFLCSPDLESTSPAEDGRRLIKLGTFSYRVVNGAKYRAIRDEEERRKQVREAMQRHREKKKKLPKKGPPLTGEIQYKKGIEDGTIDNDGVPIPPPKEEYPED